MLIPKRIFKRSFFGYVNIAFNRVDISRLEVVGADRLCAEWVLKNSGAVKISGNPPITITKYNELPKETVPIKIIEIDATNACIMKIGFEHLKDCNMIDRIVLHRCFHMENESLGYLHHANNSMKYLQVSSCHNVIDSGLLLLRNLTNLKQLILFDLPYVKNLNDVVKEIKIALPDCEINAK